MKKEIDINERKYFDIMYKNIESNFPKSCPCGASHNSELDYNEMTSPLEGYMEDDLNKNKSSFLFFRNCSSCNTSNILTLDGEGEGREEFMQYVRNRAQKEDSSFENILNDVREEYNEIFLPRMWANEQMSKNPDLYENYDYHLNSPMRRIYYMI